MAHNARRYSSGDFAADRVKAVLWGIRQGFLVQRDAEEDLGMIVLEDHALSADPAQIVGNRVGQNGAIGANLLAVEMSEKTLTEIGYFVD